MEIKWTNVIVAAMALFAFVVAVRSHRQIGGFLATMKEIGPGHTAEEEIVGLIAFGLVLVTLVAIVKVLTQNDRRDG